MTDDIRARNRAIFSKVKTEHGDVHSVVNVYKLDDAGNESCGDCCGIVFKGCVIRF